MGDRLKILFFYNGIDPNYRSIFSFPYALAKHADVKYYGKREGYYRIEENPKKHYYMNEEGKQLDGKIHNSIPWQTYGHLVKYGSLSRDRDALEIIKKLYPKDYPDAVVTTVRPITSFIPKNFDKCKCLRVALSIELHNDFSHSRLGRERLQWCRENKYNLVFKSTDPNNRLSQSKWLKDTGVAVEMNPPSVNTDFFYDKKLPKKYDVANIFCRKSPKTYPLRMKIHETLTTQEQWSYRAGSAVWIKGERAVVPHKIFKGDYEPKGGPRGEDYVNAICQGRVFATGSGVLGRAMVFKWFEVPACNTLLMTNLPPRSPDDMNDLGFKPNVNFVEINANNFLERIQYYLSHPSEAETIAQRGYELIRSKHSQDIRAKQFIDKLKKYV